MSLLIDRSVLTLATLIVGVLWLSKEWIDGVSPRGVLILTLIVTSSGVGNWGLISKLGLVETNEIDDGYRNVKAASSSMPDFTY